MTRKDIFLENLRKQTPEALGVDALLRQQQQRWLGDVKRLMQTVSEWLDKGVQQGLIHVEPRSVTLAEEDLGSYEAPALKIQLRTAHVHIIQVEPRAMRIPGVIVAGHRIMGVSGRVDLICGAARVMLLRRESKDFSRWEIVTLDGTTVDLSEESFFDVLDDLIR